MQIEDAETDESLDAVGQPMGIIIIIMQLMMIFTSSSILLPLALPFGYFIVRYKFLVAFK